MKKLLAIFFVALSATTAISAGSSASVAPQDRAIVVQAPMTSVQLWKRNVQRQLDRKMRIPATLMNMPPLTGYSRVRFECGPDERAANVQIIGGSSNHRLDRHAVRTVASLKKLGTLPNAFSGRAIEARLFFASSDSQLARQQRAATEQAAAQALASGGTSPVLVLAAGTGSRRLAQP